MIIEMKKLGTVQEIALAVARLRRTEEIKTIVMRSLAAADARNARTLATLNAAEIIFERL
jgi:hypothetical protein